MSGVLLVRLKGLGDIVHSLPALAVLRQRFPPPHRVGYLCQRPFGQLLAAETGVEVFEIPPGGSRGAALTATLQMARRIRRAGFSLLIDLYCNPRSAAIALMSGIPRRLGFDYRVRRWAYHETWRPPEPNKHLCRLFLDFLDHFGLGGPVALRDTGVSRPHPWGNGGQAPSPLRASCAGGLGGGSGEPRLTVDPALAAAARAWLTEKKLGGPILGLNPHATYMAKAWPAANFVAMGRRWVAVTGGSVVVTWGPGEKAAADAVVADIGMGASAAPPGAIPAFVALLAQLDLFLTADTGPMNLAWAAGTPTVALFGPTTPTPVAPRGPQHLVLRCEELSCLCCHREICPDPRCMTGLTPDRVWAAVLAHYPRFFAPAVIGEATARSAS